MNNYLCYHLHSDYSLLDSCTKFEDYVAKAVESGQTALASTEHGNIYNWVTKQKICERAGIKYIHGCEVYLTVLLEHTKIGNSGEIEKYKIRDNLHTILLAKNMEGLKELNSLITKSSDDLHFYYKPRISFDEFLGISDNIISTSACLGSPLNKSNIDKYVNTINKEIDNTKEKIKVMEEEFENATNSNEYTNSCDDIDLYYNDILEKYNVCLQGQINEISCLDSYIDKLLDKYNYYEIQYHNCNDQIEFNKYLYKQSLEHNKPLIAGTDTHNINEYKSECRKILLRAKGIEFQNEEEFDLTFCTYDKLISKFKVQNSLPEEIYMKAIENTNILESTVEDIVLDKSIKYPHLYENDNEVYIERTYKMLDEKIKNGIIPQDEVEQFKKNIEEELEVFKKVDMLGFMLSMSEICSWAKENNHPLGAGRGSCFTESALIQCKDTLKTINNVCIGDYVLTSDGSFQKVLLTTNYDVNEDLIEFEYSQQGGCRKKYKNQCTQEHKILVHRDDVNQYIQANDLQVGDSLCSPFITNVYANKPDDIIDLNIYNKFGYKYDDKYIYEKKYTNSSFKYSSHWMDKNTEINATMIKNIMNGHTPSNTIVDKILDIVPFKTLDNYRRYLQKHAIKIVQLPRYVHMNYLFNLFIGMMYGDGWTSLQTSLGFAINETTKGKLNKYVFYKIAEYFGVEVTSIKYANKNLIQLFVNSKILNSWFKTEYFESKKHREKIFNINLLQQSTKNLRAIYIGLLKTDGSVIANKTCFDNTSLSIISAFRLLSNIVNKDILALDVRCEHIDSRGYHSKESYKVRRFSQRDIEQDNDYMYFPITKIEKLKNNKIKVYDLTIESTNSFVVNNIVVHNCTGSTCAYVTDITDVNPVKWNTVFSRFCNENRVEIGDIDTDIYEDDRPYVYDYIINRVGKEKTAYVLAIGTASDKRTIEEIGRALKYSLDEVSKIKNDYESNPEMAKGKYKELFYYFDGINGVNLSQSQHPAGIIASPITLDDNYGCLNTRTGLKILQLDMNASHEANLAKYDILGLKQIGIIKKTYEYIGQHYPKSHEINWNDKSVWDNMKKSNIGIFQFESDFAYKILKDFDCNSIEDMSLVNAMIRPSGASYRDKLVKKEFNHNPSKMVDDLLKDSYGYLVYQESIIAFLQQICGLSGGDADSVRRAIGHKSEEDIQKALPSIMDGYCNNSDKPREVAEKEAKEFLKVIEDASAYSFGKNHSISYCLIGYMCAYLRCYYPLEFLTAFFNCSKSEEDFANGTELAKVLNIKIKEPRFRHAKSDYFYDSESNVIYKGMRSIKFINNECAESLYKFKNKEYNHFVDLLNDILHTTLDDRQTKILINLNFFEEFGEEKTLMEIYTLFKTFIGAKKQYRKTFNEEAILNYGETICNIIKRNSTITKCGCKNLLFETILPECEDYIFSKKIENYNYKEIIDFQKELLGYINLCTNKPEDKQKIIIKEKYIINSKRKKDFGKPWVVLITAQSIGTSKISKFSIEHSLYKQNPFDEEDIIEVLDYEYKENYQKTIKYWYITKYKIL